MKVLITGAEGFVGSHLVELLVSDGFSVAASAINLSAIGSLARIKGEFDIIACDLRDFTQVERMVHESRPDFIHHLAAISFVPQAQSNHREVVDTNVLGTLNLLEAIRRIDGARPRLLFVSSAEVYGIQPADAFPLTEATSIGPSNLYASTKASGEILVEQYSRSYGLESVIVRPFNHIGPRQAPSFAISSFASQIAAIEAGRQEPVLRVGNLEARRDILDVRDVVRAYSLCMTAAILNGPYNICSGEAHGIGELLHRLLGMSKASIKIEQDPDRMRPSDIPLMLGSNRKIERDLCWRPEIDIDRTLEDILEDVRQRG